MDMIGQINPPFSKFHQWVLAVTDYFTKWVEAVPMRSVASEDVINYVQFLPQGHIGFCYSAIPCNLAFRWIRPDS